MKPQNPPAFPSATAPGMHGCWGMALRDYFAASAITAAAENLRKNLSTDGIDFSFGDDEQMDALADDCYAIADALLEARGATTTIEGHPVRRLDPGQRRRDYPATDIQSEASLSEATKMAALENELLEYITRVGSTSASGISWSRQFRNRRAEARSALESLMSKGAVLKQMHAVGNPTYTPARCAP